MSFCLPLEETKKFIKALKEGVIEPGKLAEMSSLERRSFFEELVGKDNAINVNTLFESKLLLKNQQAGMVAWAEKVTGIKPAIKKGLIEKINKLDKVLSAADEQAFLEDLASKRFGTDISFEEAKHVVNMAKDINQKKSLIKEDSPLRSKERLDYGLQDYLLKEYVSELKLKNKPTISSPGDLFRKTAGIFKSLVASLDNSFFGRQGLKVLFTNPDIWGKSFLKSWGDMAKELKGIDAIAPIKADIYSRPNALNGKYTESKLAIGIRGEEAYPSSLPSRIPYLGKLFKASESAYNGAALRMRADLFDRFVSKAERLGKDMTDPLELSSQGKLANSMTGRGNIGKLDVIGDEINVALFSVKFLKSNLDTLTAHQFDSGMTKYGKQQAALNTLKIVGSTAAVLLTAKILDPDSVDFDPRSSNFGKIRIGDTRFDVSGGMSGIVTLASRIVPTLHNGKWGWWYKTGDKSKFVQMAKGTYGELTPMEMLYSFGEGKTSPIFHTGIDILKQKNFKGEVPTVGSVVKGLITPLPVITIEELQNNPDSANMLMSIILNELGIGVNTYSAR